MKRFFSKFKCIFIFLLIIPMIFVFSSCGKSDNSNDNGGSNSEIEQPEGESGGGDSEDDDPVEPEVQTELFTVSIDYNLPDFYDGLLESEIESVEVSQGFTLPTFVGTEYFNYFDGWFLLSDNSEINDTVINASKDENVSIYANWKENDMNQTFATAGLEFEFGIDDNERNYAVPISYSGTSSIVVIPQVVINDSGDSCYVESIGEDCFKNNQVIKDVRTKMLDFSVNDGAFQDSSLELIDFSKITNIGDSAFKNSKVKNVVFSNKLNSVSSYMFADCSELVKVDFSAVTNSSLNSILSYSFYGCNKLSDIKLSGCITIIETSVFENCSSISDFEFIETSMVTSLGGRAFAGCVGIENLEIPAKIVSYGTGSVFVGCEIKNIVLNNLWYSAANGSSATFTRYYGNLTQTLESVTLKGNLITVIHTNYFRNYSKLKTFVMNDTITKIENSAFNNCDALENITFSSALVGDNINIDNFKDTAWFNNLSQNDYYILNNTLVYVSENFAGVDGLFEIPNNVKYLANSLFGDNNHITSLSISEFVEFINVRAFEDSNIENITISQDNESYIADNKVLFKIDELGNKVELIAYYAAQSGGVYEVPSTVKVVYDYAFSMKNKPDYVFISAENVQVVFDSYASTEYVFANDTISSNENPNLVVIYRYISQEVAGYEVESNLPVFTDSENLNRYNLVVVNGEDGDYYYLVTVMAGEISIEELSGFCPRI